MAILNFPSNPSNGDVYKENGITYTYVKTSSSGFWSANNNNFVDDIYVNTNGDELTGQLLIDNGKDLTKPPLAFTGDVDTGFISLKEDEISLVVGGKVKFNVNSDGHTACSEHIVTQKGYHFGEGKNRIVEVNGNQLSFIIDDKTRAYVDKSGVSLIDGDTVNITLDISGDARLAKSLTVGNFNATSANVKGSKIYENGLLQLQREGDTQNSNQISAVDILLGSTTKAQLFLDGSASFAEGIKARKFETFNADAGSTFLYAKLKDNTQGFRVNADGTLQVGWNATKKDAVHQLISDGSVQFASGKSNFYSNGSAQFDRRGEGDYGHLKFNSDNAGIVIHDKDDAAKTTLGYDGSGIFKGDVTASSYIAGENPNAGGKTGFKALSSGSVQVSGPNNDSALWTGYKTGASAVTSSIAADGSATLQNLTIKSQSAGSTLLSNGTATFAGNKVSITEQGELRVGSSFKVDTNNRAVLGPIQSDKNDVGGAYLAVSNAGENLFGALVMQASGAIAKTSTNVLNAFNVFHGTASVAKVGFDGSATFAGSLNSGNPGIGTEGIGLSAGEFQTDNYSLNLFTRTNGTDTSVFNVFSKATGSATNLVKRIEFTSDGSCTFEGRVISRNDVFVEQPTLGTYGFIDALGRHYSRVNDGAEVVFQGGTKEDPDAIKILGEGSGIFAKGLTALSLKAQPAGATTSTLIDGLGFTQTDTSGNTVVSLKSDGTGRFVGLLTANGGILSGTTNQAPAAANLVGVSLNHTGYLSISRENNLGLEVNYRGNTGPGSIAKFMKDGVVKIDLKNTGAAFFDGNIDCEKVSAESTIQTIVANPSDIAFAASNDSAGKNTCVVFGDGGAYLDKEVDVGNISTGNGIRAKASGELVVRNDSNTAKYALAIAKGGSGSQNYKAYITNNGQGSFTGSLLVNSGAVEVVVTSPKDNVFVGGFDSISSEINGSGDARFNGDIYAKGISSATGNAITSDQRFKTNIEPANEQLPDVMALGAGLKNFDWIETAPVHENHRDRRFLGLIAQEAQAISPQITHEITFKDDNGVEDTFLAIDKTILVMKLLGAASELASKLSTLESDTQSQIQILEQRIAVLELDQYQVISTEYSGQSTEVWGAGESPIFNSDTGVTSWVYKNEGNESIQWTFYKLDTNDSNAKVHKLKDIKSMFIKMQNLNDYPTLLPIIEVFTKPLGDEDDVNVNYRSRVVYGQTNTEFEPNNNPFILWAETNTYAYSELSDRFELTKNDIGYSDDSSQGPHDPEEDILKIVLTTHAAYPAETYHFALDEFGFITEDKVHYKYTTTNEEPPTNYIDENGDGFADGIPNYMLMTGNGQAINLTKDGWNPPITWDITPRAIRVENGYRVLLIGSGEDLGLVGIWEVDATGARTDGSGWKTLEEAVELGWEDIFNYDINGDQYIGQPYVDADGDGFVDGVANYKLMHYNGQVVDLLQLGTSTPIDIDYPHTLRAVSNQSGYQILVIGGGGSGLGNFALWTAGLDGQVTESSGWKSPEEAVELGWEEIFNYDINGDYYIGEPPTNYQEIPVTITIAESAQAVAGSNPPVERANYDGWGYENPGDTGKIHWYLFSQDPQDPNATSYTLGDIQSLFLKLRNTHQSETTLPHINVYTLPYGDGNDAQSWYRSRCTYAATADANLINGDAPFVTWVGQQPHVYTDMPHAELVKDGYTSEGPQDYSERITLIAVSSNSAAEAGAYNFILEEFGFVTTDNLYVKITTSK